MAACFGSFGYLQIAILLYRVLKRGRSSVAAGEGKRPELGNQKSGFQLWLCQIDLLFLSLSLPISKWV